MFNFYILSSFPPAKRDLRLLAKFYITSKIVTAKKRIKIGAITCLLSLPYIDIATNKVNSKLFETKEKYCAMVVR